MSSHRQVCLIAGALALGAACGDERAAPAAPRPPRPERPARATPPRPAADEATAAEGDAWSSFATAARVVEDGRVSAEVEALLDARAARRAIEGQRTLGALLDIEAAFATTCSPADLSSRLLALQTLEEASLAADREVLARILELAGPQGRAAIWDVAAPETAIPGPRAALLERAAADLSTWVGGDAATADRLPRARAVLDLQLAQKAGQLDARIELARLAADLLALDPEDEDAATRATTGLAAVDAALLRAQRERVELVPAACETIDTASWIALLDRGELRRFIGILGEDDGGSEGAEATQSADRPPERGQRGKAVSGSEKGRKATDAPGRGKATDGRRSAAGRGRADGRPRPEDRSGRE